MMPSSLRQHALYEVLADQLRERILCHELPPGSKVSELDIARRYGVSRTPVREALKVLGQEGLVTINLRKGTTVSTLSPAELNEAKGLHALLLAYGLKQAPTKPIDKNSLLSQMLLMVERRLQLAGLQPALAIDKQTPARCIPVYTKRRLHD